MKNQTIDPKALQSLKDQCKKSGKPYVIDEIDPDDQAFATFRFPGTHEGREAIFDVFLYTLYMEYLNGIYDEAESQVRSLYPQFAKADFDELEGPHIEKMEEIVEELSTSDDFSVAEFVEELVEDGGIISIDACLNVPEITEEVIAKFIKDYTAGTLKLDETFYSFDLGEEE